MKPGERFQAELLKAWELEGLRDSPASRAAAKLCEVKLPPPPPLPREFAPEDRPTLVRELSPHARLADLAYHWRGLTQKRQRALEAIAARMYAASERERDGK